MIRLLAFLLLANTLLAQPPASPEALNLGQAIGVGAVDAYALKKQVDSLQEEVRRLTGENESLRAQLRVTKQPEPARESRLKFTMVTASDCEACPSKLAIVRPWAERAGYLFENENHLSMRGGTYPRYRVCFGDYCEEFNAPVNRLGEAVAERLRKWGVAFTR